MGPTATAQTKVTVTVTLSVTPEAERKLLARATETGQDVAHYLSALVEDNVKGPPKLSELLAPIREDFRRSGMTEQELDTLLEDELAQVREERRQAKDQAP